jgi:hypothetical protein
MQKRGAPMHVQKPVFTHPEATSPFIRSLSKLRFCRFSDSFEAIFDLKSGGNIDKSILPPDFKSKIGQNNPEKRRTLNFERDLLSDGGFISLMGGFEK